LAFNCGIVRPATAVIPRTGSSWGAIDPSISGAGLARRIKLDQP
jgi:hypothetical protein